MKKITSLSIVLVLGLAPTAFAAPYLTIGSHQDFEKNDYRDQLNTFNLIEDSENPVFKAGPFKIHLPEEVEVIYDTDETLSQAILFGTAVDTGKVAPKSEMSFEDGDRTLVLEFLEDFEAGETFGISQIYLEGFYREPLNSYPLTYENDGHTYIDPYHIDVDDSTEDNDRPPETPENIEFEIVEGGIQITWTDSTDLDLQYVKVLRSQDGDPVGAEPHHVALPGEELYLDEDVIEGTLYTYVLQASDGTNESILSESFDITYMVTEDSPDDPTTEPDTPEDPENPEQPEQPETPEDPETPEEPELETERPNFEQEEGSWSFTDIDGHWAKENIQWMAYTGAVNGYSDDSFKPDAKINRAEVASILFRVLVSEAIEIEGVCFNDIPEDAWYRNAVCMFESSGLINGNPDGSYEPAEDMNRAEFIHLVVNAYNAEAIELPEEPSFTDVSEEAWYYESVEQAYQLGLVEGYSCGAERCYQPESSVTRAEATTILWRAFETLLRSDRLEQTCKTHLSFETQPWCWCLKSVVFEKVY